MEQEKSWIVSKCPVTKWKQLTFGIAAEAMGLINTRAQLQQTWSTYDVWALFHDYRQNGVPPYQWNPTQRDIFVRYSLSQISTYATTIFLQSPTVLTKRQFNIKEVTDTEDALKKDIVRISEISYNKISALYTTILQNLLNENPTSQEEKLMQMLTDEDIDELQRFSTSNGTLPTISAICDDFYDILRIGTLDIDSMIASLRKDKINPSRALSNFPAMLLYFSQHYPKRFWFFRTKKIIKAMEQFMKNGYPHIQFNPGSLQREYTHSAEDFQERAKHVLKNHPELNGMSYAGCPLLYAKQDWINLITALHIKIAEIVFQQLLELKNPST